MGEKKNEKAHLSVVLFGIAAISLTGCYTQIAMSDDNGYTYSAPEPIIIIIQPPPPPPVPPAVPEPIIEYLANPKEKIRYSETRPPSNEGIRDDIRNSGGRNQGGKRSG